MSMSRGIFGALAVCLAVTGCAEKEAAVSLTAVGGTPVQIGAAPYLSVGVAVGDPIQEFYRVRAPFLLPDGRLAVPLEAGSEIRVFGPDGEFLERLGRSGEGPGEFINLTSAWPRGDTIEAFDSRLRRVTRFLPDGSVQVVQLQGPGASETAPAGALSEGWVTAGIAGGEYPGRDLIAVNWFSRDGVHSEEVGRVGGMIRIDTPGMVGPHPLSPRAVVRVGNGGVYWGETFSPRIQIWSPSDGRSGVITWEAEGPLDPVAALDLVKDSVSAGVESGILPESSERLVQGADATDRVSVFWDFMVDELGFIWVCPFDPARHAFALGDMGGGGYITGGSSRGGQWRILSPEGIEVGSIEIPEGLRLAQITRGAVVGVRVDTLDLEYVHVYRLERY